VHEQTAPQPTCRPLERQALHTAHRRRGEHALGASTPVRLNAALEEVRRRLFGDAAPGGSGDPLPGPRAVDGPPVGDP
jgi:hypothetical protein